MSIAVFYAPNAKDSSYLSEEESFHASKVLRLRVGETIHLLDGRGKKFATKIFSECGVRWLTSPKIRTKAVSCFFFH